MARENKIIDIDKGWDELKKTLRTLAARKSYVKAGVIGEKATAEHDGVSNVEVAVFNEYGTAQIPARPFVGGSFEANREKYVANLKAGLKKLYGNELTTKQLLGLLGAQMATDMKTRITSDPSPFVANAPATLKRKRAKGRKGAEPRPLVDSGQVLKSISWEVVEGE